MKRCVWVFIACALLIGCRRGKLETCKLLEIEPREMELSLKDTDIEGWELEVYCGDRAWDVAEKELKRIGIRLRDYYDKTPRVAEQKLASLGKRLRIQKEDDRSSSLYATVDGGHEAVELRASKDD